MIVLGPIAASAKTARDHVAKIAADWPIDSDDLRMVTSELTSNAIKHVGRDEIVVDAYVDEDEVEGLYVVEVWDASKEAPMAMFPSNQSISGRGLWLVQNLADDWGYEISDEDEGGKVVYAAWAVKLK
ncbi:ATP-binding protein [Actinomadura sp. KC345]|uniref:ATP-binding protein n=1 Tax=Actinomadura sp. KC345 TaxID=2530371 RepID=UPI00104806A4|nr:ATP-binding protein [Actinomadura sp. KC345]TDC54320.1 ATP-binding protein [Actinomadura sp. KC345]